MLSASLFALALAAANPADATATARDPEIPSSAPTDDYGFVAWCYGALQGHMELRPLVRNELEKLSPGAPDDEAKQRAAGEEYLALYTRALRAAEKASATSLQGRLQQANARGHGIWTAARTAEPRTRMWSYLMWELPARCEIAAKRLEERSSLFGEALKPAAAAAPDPRPVAKASPPTAPTDADGLRGSQ